MIVLRSPFTAKPLPSPQLGERVLFEKASIMPRRVSLIDEFGLHRSMLVGQDYQMSNGFLPILRTTGATPPTDPLITKSGGITPTWKWGDGNEDTGLGVTHNYAVPGDYKIRWNADPASILTFECETDDISEIYTKGTWVNMTQLSVQSNNLTNLDTFASWIDLEALFCNTNTNLVNFDTFDTWTNIYFLYCYGNSLTNLVVFDTWTNLLGFRCENNSLTIASIDAMLIAIDGTGSTNGTLKYENNPGSADIDRSGPAATAKANLVTKSWVITN